jgi:antitoxin ParD1/3/4
MDITLTPELEKVIQEKVESGQYASREAVVRAAIELLREYDVAEDRLEALLEESEGGRQGVELTTKARADLENRAVAALRAKNPA